jgi:hypothetical protein
LRIESQNLTDSRMDVRLLMLTALLACNAAYLIWKAKGSPASRIDLNGFKKRLKDVASQYQAKMTGTGERVSRLGRSDEQVQSGTKSPDPMIKVNTSLDLM